MNKSVIHVVILQVPPETCQTGRVDALCNVALWLFYSIPRSLLFGVTLYSQSYISASFHDDFAFFALADRIAAPCSFPPCFAPSFAAGSSASRTLAIASSSVGIAIF